MTKAGPKGGGDQSDTAYINELWLAKTLMGGWSGGLSGLEVIYDQYVQRLQGQNNGTTKIDQAKIAAEAMANQYLQWANSNGFTGGPGNVWWTAKSDFSWDSVNFAGTSSWESITKNHPADVLCQFASGGRRIPYLGLSAKMVAGKGDAPIKNPGAKKVSTFLFGTDSYFKDIFNNTRDALIADVKKIDPNVAADTTTVRSLIPASLWNKIVATSDGKKLAEYYKAECLTRCRDTLLSGLAAKSQLDVFFYILDDLMDTSKVPMYVKVTGNYITGASVPTTATATVEEPAGQNNSKYQALMSGKPLVYTAMKGNRGRAGFSVGVSGDGKGIIAIRWKFASSDFRTGLKMSIAPWAGNKDTAESENPHGQKISTDTIVP